MLKQEQNDVILKHINSEIQMTPSIAKRISTTFNTWFQSLVQQATEPVVPEMPEEESQ